MVWVFEAVSVSISKLMSTGVLVVRKNESGHMHELKINSTSRPIFTVPAELSPKSALNPTGLPDSCKGVVGLRN